MNVCQLTMKAMTFNLTQILIISWVYKKQNHQYFVLELEFAFFLWTAENKVEFSLCSEIGQQTRWGSEEIYRFSWLSPSL